MKVRFGICARNLQNFGNVLASLSCGGEEFGRTEVIDGSANPTWRKVIVLDCNDVERVVVIRVLSDDNGEVIARAQFNVAAIMAHKTSVLYEGLDDGSTIFAYATEHIIDQSPVQVQIHGRGLKNISRSRKMTGSVSDPFYEMRNASGNIVYTSEVQDDNLDPDWSVAEVDLQSLCDGDFDAPIEITVFDHNRHTKHRVIGVFRSTLNDLIVAAAYGKSFVLSKGKDEMGRILVQRAKCVCFENAAKMLVSEASAKELSDAATMVAASKSQVAGAVQERLNKARQYADARQKSVMLASATLAEARIAAEAAEAEAKSATQTADEIKSELKGTLNFQFAGKELKNSELFQPEGTNPFFILQKQKVKEDGQNAWSHVFISNVVQNDLNPVWKESEVAVCDVCSDNLDEQIRVVVFDWHESGNHKLLGYFETSISGIISTQRSAEDIKLTSPESKAGRILVPRAELVGFVDPKVAEENAKELAEQAESARSLAISAERKANLAEKRAAAAEKVARVLNESSEDALKQLGSARKIVLEKTVNRRLEELGL